MTIPTIPDYLANRQSAVPQADNAAFNARLDAVVKTFGADWLGRDHSNPVQALWSRKDAQSTNELLLLGDAIANLSTADAKWVERQADLIKNGDAGTRAGALFELLGLNLFHAPGQQVLPATANNPGYDGSVILDDGSSLMLSIKNYGISSKETSSGRRVRKPRMSLWRYARRGGKERSSALRRRSTPATPIGIGCGTTSPPSFRLSRLPAKISGPAGCKTFPRNSIR